MKRDMDLVRAILLACEAHPAGGAPNPLVIDGRNEEEVGFHVLLMMEAGLLVGVDVSVRGGPSPRGVPRRLTWAGYEFLDSTSEPSAWERTKAAAKSAGGWSFEILKDLAVAAAKAKGRALLGLPSGD